jgi:hypothetical protein
MLVGAFARAFGVGILPAMPGRGHRLWVARAIAASAAAAALLAVGCDSHSKPRAVDDPSTYEPVAPAGPSSTTVLPSTATPTNPTTTPVVGESALASAYPSAAAAGPRAVAVVRAFYDGINREIDTGDESAVAKYFRSTCTRCISEVVAVQNLRDGKHSIRGGHLHIVRVNSVHPSYTNLVTVTITGTADASQQVDENGNVTKTFDAVPPTQLLFDVDIDMDPPVIANLTLGPK